MGKEKVGIITYHFARNYGAVLQCYALRKYLEKVGYDATVLNAISRVQEKNNSVFHKKDGIKNIIVNVVLLPFVKQRLRKEKGFADFVENYIPHTEKVVNAEQLKALVDREQYQAIITGSDQVWNPHIFDFDEMFYFPFETKAKKIGYSVSIGESSLEDIRGYSIYAKDFPYVGLREKGAKEKVEAICRHSVVDTVDPVLLLPREDWETFVDKSSPLAKEKYLLCYLIDKKPIKRNMAIAEQIAKARGLKIKYIWMHLEKESFRGNFVNDASPVEFLNYMYHASAVMTDGYHGTVFSTIFNKPMYSVINNRQSTDSRIRDYLTLIGLESRIFYGDAPAIPKEEIDYTEVDPKIRSVADASKAFLQSAIDNERVVI